MNHRLPPKPPSGVFDIRFSGDSRLCFEDECVIEVMNNGQPIIIDFAINDNENWELGDENEDMFECSGVHMLDVSGDLPSR